MMRSLLPALALLLAPGAFAQEAEPPPGENPIAIAVRIMIEATAEQQKASPLGPVQYGAMPPGQKGRFPLSGQSDKMRLVIASCDFDCTQLDLVAYDESGQVIASDAGHDRPVLKLPANAPGALSIEVSMTQCAVRVCRFGVGLYTRD